MIKMKKLIALVLVAIMILSLCACGNENPEPSQGDTVDTGNHGDNGQQPTDPPSPSEEEWAVLRAYRDLINQLIYYAETGDAYVYDAEGNYLEDSDALAYIFSQLLSIDTAVIDKWKSTEYCGVNHITDYNGNQVDWDIDSYLSNFVKLNNVLLQQLRSSLDQKGTEKQESAVTYYYNDHGYTQRISGENNAFELMESNPWNMSGTKEYTYDDAGRAVQIKYYSSTDVRYTVDITYDENGNKVNEHITQSAGEIDITYEYDDFDRLVKMELPLSFGSNTVVTFTYAYDENGNLTMEEKRYHHYDSTYEADITDDKYIREYVYDADGKLISGVNKYQRWSHKAKWVSSGSYYKITQTLSKEQVDQLSFTTDDHGNLLTVVITYGILYDTSGNNAGEIKETPEYVSRTYEFVYGDCYFYSPVK